MWRLLWRDLAGDHSADGEDVTTKRRLNSAELLFTIGGLAIVVVGLLYVAIR